MVKWTSQDVQWTCGPGIFIQSFMQTNSHCESIICHSLKNASCNNDPLCVVWWLSNGCYTFGQTNLLAITYNETLYAPFYLWSAHERKLFLRCTVKVHDDCIWAKVILAFNLAITYNSGWVRNKLTGKLFSLVTYGHYICSTGVASTLHTDLYDYAFLQHTKSKCLFNFLALSLFISFVPKKHANNARNSLQKESLITTNKPLLFFQLCFLLVSQSSIIDKHWFSREKRAWPSMTVGTKNIVPSYSWYFLLYLQCETSFTFVRWGKTNG